MPRWKHLGGGAGSPADMGRVGIVEPRLPSPPVGQGHLRGEERVVASGGREDDRHEGGAGRQPEPAAAAAPGAAVKAGGARVDGVKGQFSLTGAAPVVFQLQRSRRRTRGSIVVAAGSGPGRLEPVPFPEEHRDPFERSVQAGPVQGEAGSGQVRGRKIRRVCGPGIRWIRIFRIGIGFRLRFRFRLRFGFGLRLRLRFRFGLRLRLGLRFGFRLGLGLRFRFRLGPGHGEADSGARLSTSRHHHRSGCGSLRHSNPNGLVVPLDHRGRHAVEGDRARLPAEIGALDPDLGVDGSRIWLQPGDYRNASGHGEGDSGARRPPAVVTTTGPSSPPPVRMWLPAALESE